jgi:ubiquinone/menaquinone biosynthesis C-methylase UbiE
VDGSGNSLNLPEMARKVGCPNQEATDALVQVADLADGLSVLDIASGTGEPAITLAKAVGPNGHVMATDLTRGMLGVAEENARCAAVTNVAFEQADAHSLPFPDEAFDRFTVPILVATRTGKRASAPRSTRA